MNLSFSTRGWPDLSWDEMMELALDMGFGGIEVYNLPKFDPLLDRRAPSTNTRPQPPSGNSGRRTCGFPALIPPVTFPRMITASRL